jgi:8-oxo-dGTP pyrophosphatase MutT (NUDIX family)
VKPTYDHWPGSDAIANDPSLSIEQQLQNFFDRPWVEHGDPEVLFIKRASREGDRWTGHVALPGGKRDPEDEDDRAAAVREASEEIGFDLTTDDVISVGNLPERVVTTSWGSVPYVFPVFAINLLLLLEILIAFSLQTYGPLPVRFPDYSEGLPNLETSAHRSSFDTLDPTPSSPIAFPPDS